MLGGSSGIGYAVAEYALEEGAQVVIASSNTQRVGAALKSLQALNMEGAVRGSPLDLTDTHAVRQFFDHTGAFDHLVFTAGDSLRLGTVAQTELLLAKRAFDIHYWGALAAVKYGAPNLAKGGSIVLTTGIAALRPRSGWAFGASVCAAMEGLTRALAVELAPLRVNAVSPGLIATNLWQVMSGADRQAMYQEVARRLPVGDVGEAREVAAAYVYLMESPFSTGQVHVVDGGDVLV